MKLSRKLRAVRFRVVLPAVQTILGVSLWLAAELDWQRAGAWYEACVEDKPGVVCFDPRAVVDRRPHWAVDANFALNFPAVVLALPLEFVLEHSPYLRLAAFAACVGLLWYWIGRGIDRRRGAISPPEARRLGRVWTLTYVAAILVSAVSVLFGLLMLALAHYGLGRAVGCAVMLWSALLLRHFWIELSSDGTRRPG